MKETNIALDIDLREKNDTALLETKIADMEVGKRLLVYICDISMLDKIRQIDNIEVMSVLKKNEVNWIVVLKRL
ncbi:MAG: hypothetical protein GXP60_04150 [Epsilonproteobacteria bacterium]|nr:hypothetical protein [Campylobacterota bacterium]